MADEQALLLELESLAREIESLDPKLVELIAYQKDQLRELRSKFTAQVQFEPRYWTIKSRIDGLTKLHVLLPNSLARPETMGILALTRYVFELTVWLKIIKKDERYGLTYYRRLIENQLEHYRTLRAQYEREVVFLESIDAAEEERIKLDVAAIAKMADERDRNAAAAKLGGTVMSDIDELAARSFAVYARDAKTNGYGFQAYLVKTKVIPKVDEQLAQVANEEEVFKRTLSAELLAFTNNDRKWSRKAAIAEMQDGYEFIYAFTSRLLHAEPASMSVIQQTLTLHEMQIFLRYVQVCIADVFKICAIGAE